MGRTLGELARLLDDQFAVRDFVELTNWDFALDQRERESLLSRGAEMFQNTFNGWLNGTGGQLVDRVYLIVFPERSLLDQIGREEELRGSPGAMILTHHPCDMETSDRGFIAIPEAQLDRLRDANVALYILHAPLDCHERISTRGALADGLGLTRVERFAPYVGGFAGVVGEQPPESFASFAERVRTLCEIPSFLPDQVRFNGKSVSRIAIVAGGGDDLNDLKQAQELGADTFLAGHWWTPHRGDWPEENRRAIAGLLPSLDMNLLSASHDGSELVVFRDRLLPLIESYGVETRLIRQADHWR